MPNLSESIRKYKEHLRKIEAGQRKTKLLSDDAAEVLIKRGKTRRLVVCEKPTCCPSARVKETKSLANGNPGIVPTKPGIDTFVDEGLKWMQCAIIQPPWHELVKIVHSSWTKKFMRRDNEGPNFEELVKHLDNADPPFDRPITILPIYRQNNWIAGIFMDTGNQIAISILDSFSGSTFIQEVNVALVDALRRQNPRRQIVFKNIQVPPRETKADGDTYLLNDVLRWLNYIMKHPDSTYQEVAGHMSTRPDHFQRNTWHQLITSLSTGKVLQLNTLVGCPNIIQQGVSNSNTTIHIPSGHKIENDGKIFANGTTEDIPIRHSLLAKLTEEMNKLDKNKKIRCLRQIEGHEIKITTVPNCPTRFRFIK